ncbi:MAG TPA: phosphoglycerate mutase (2,3-diphosphoglycerate-independent), partial [Candidatus Moranbacteria bacterium]|nr:phosphoglycerate mutase (2,3-diphosphoglycerate-independent) [Candidatus Moranbacteria bacterium]
MYKPVVLVILDGWGISKNSQGNIIKRAKLPTIDKFNKFYPMTTLQASGISVGIPWGENGNSEVGHTVIGAGRIIYQNLPRITLSIQDGTFFNNEALLSAVENVKKNNSNLHLMGLLSEGSVHSYTAHLHALLELAKKHGIENVFIHVFTDGRDSSPVGGTKAIKDLQKKLKEFQVGKIATLCGRNWAMDRKNDWKNIEKAYRLLTEGVGEKIQDPIKYLQESYSHEITDEHIEPAIIMENDNPIGIIKNNDSVIFFNFREDRARELTKAFVLPGFGKFKREKRLKLEFVTMTEYEKDLPVPVAFPPLEINNGLGEILSNN